MENRSRTMRELLVLLESEAALPPVLEHTGEFVTADVYKDMSGDAGYIFLPVGQTPDFILDAESMVNDVSPVHDSAEFFEYVGNADLPEKDVVPMDLINRMNAIIAAEEGEADIEELSDLLHDKVYHYFDDEYDEMIEEGVSHPTQKVIDDLKEDFFKFKASAKDAMQKDGVNKSEVKQALNRFIEELRYSIQ